MLTRPKRILAGEMSYAHDLARKTAVFGGAAERRRSTACYTGALGRVATCAILIYLDREARRTRHKELPSRPEFRRRREPLLSLPSQDLPALDASPVFPSLFATQFADRAECCSIHASALAAAGSD